VVYIQSDKVLLLAQERVYAYALGVVGHATTDIGAGVYSDGSNRFIRVVGLL
jgi:hypothetical protein